MGQNQQNSPLPLPRWTSATVHIDNPQISYTTKVTTAVLLHLSACKESCAYLWLIHCVITARQSSSTLSSCV